MKVLFNHIGYEPSDEKPLLIEAPEDTSWRSVSIVSLPDGREVLSGKPSFVGGVDGWAPGPWWRFDASPLQAPGRYALNWETPESSGQSEGFEIADGILGYGLVSDLLFYFKSQRSSGIWDKADRAAKRVDDGQARDVSGGWFDASGDVSKYLSHLSYANFMNPQQIPLVVWILGRVWHLYRDAGAPDFFLERIRDEALHGADFLVRAQDSEGFWYCTVFDQWTKDPQQRELCSYQGQEGVKRGNFHAGWRQGGGMAAAALALASTLGDGDAFSSHEYLQTAARGIEHLNEHGLNYLDDRRENIIDDYCSLLAAIELESASPHPAEDSLLVSRANSLLSRKRIEDDITWLAADEAGERSWFHASDAGLPIIALLRLSEALPHHPLASAAQKLSDELLRSQIVLGAQRNNPFAYPPHWIKTPDNQNGFQWFYPHRNPSGYWWQGENARLGSLASAALLAEKLRNGETTFRRSANRWLSWTFGANPFDICMMQGRGRNNPSYEGAFHNAPGGVCNGITSGFSDENDIAFAPEPMASDPAHNWRWGEQWLPHAVWLMFALALRQTTDETGD